MRLFDRIRHRDDIKESPCPRCGIPAPNDAIECTACGWDLRESCHGVYPGSQIQERSAPASRE